MVVLPLAAERPTAAAPSVPSSVERFRLERAWHIEAADYLLAAGYPAQATKCRNCHDPKRVVAHRMCSEHPDHPVKSMLDHCDLPVCPTCSRYRANRLVHEYGATALHYVQHGSHGHGFRHIVLTTPYGLDDPVTSWEYKSTFDAVGKTLNAVHLTLLKGQLSPSERKKGRVSLADHQIGYIAGADWGVSGKLHFHLLYRGPYIQHDLLRDRWAHFTQGAAANIRIERVKPAEEDILSVLAYVGQLEMIPAAMTPRLLSILDGRRRLRTQGVFRGSTILPYRTHSICSVCGARAVRTKTPPTRSEIAHFHRRTGQPLSCYSVLILGDGPRSSARVDKHGRHEQSLFPRKSLFARQGVYLSFCF